ncbi:MAG: ABC transporter transmembrane domain-containing protein [Desulfocapsaceae bacterium]|nr:ABC transporter transmembrane domain-containing protein [Desulfocapsaceae bacterium]
MLKKVDYGELRELLQFAYPERRLLLLGTIFLALSSLVLLIFPQAVRITIDQAVEAKNMMLINKLGIIMLIILAIQSVAAALRYYLFTLAGERTVKRIRAKLFDCLLDQEIGFFDSQKTGDLMSRINSDATVLQNTLSVNISMILRNLAATVGGLIFLFITSWQLTLLLFIILPPAALMAARFGGKVRKISQNVQQSLGAASAIADESLSNIRTVRSFAAEPVETGRFARALDKALAVARSKIKLVASFTGAISLLGSLAVILILWLGGRMVIQDELTIGTLSAFILYTMTVAISVSTLGSLWTDFMNATGASARIFQILKRTPAILNEKGRILNQVKGEIYLKDVRFAYPTRKEYPVFGKLNLRIAEGEAVALVGKSGSGKSTIAALIQRLYEPGDGSIYIDGVDIAELSASWLRRQIGTVSQEPILMSTTIRENIAYGKPEASLQEINEAAELAYASEFIEAFPDKYETLVGERGVQLSGGQKQRIAIARAMLKDPQILILDEATSALDAESEELVRKALHNLMQGRTVIVIAHRLSTVKDTDRVVVLDHGEIVEEGSHSELLQDGDSMYFNLVENQLRLN